MKKSLLEEFFWNFYALLRTFFVYLPIWLGLSLVCYYATYTIMEGSIFNPLYEWINNQYLTVKGSGDLSEIAWYKITVLFSCFHCLGTWIGFIIGAVFTFFFGMQVRYLFTPGYVIHTQLQKDVEEVLLKNFFNKLKFLILRPFFTLALTVAIGFCVSVGSLGWYSVFNYPKHKLEMENQNDKEMMDLQSMYFEELVDKCNCSPIKINQ